jgi:general secretion pathway protein D
VDGNRNFKVLATPSVYAKNASKAIIQSGQKIAVPAQILSNGAFAGGVASNSVSVEYRDVLLKLEVIPLINSDDEVTLKIAQINDNIVGTQTISGNTVPTIGTQELVTEVSVKNGASRRARRSHHRTHQR